MRRAAGSLCYFCYLEWLSVFNLKVAKIYHAFITCVF
jgi:hypothetical protein